MMPERDIEVSVVMPCLNEEKAVGACIKKIKEVFAKEQISGEIIVADNGSVDSSREIAQREGAKVVIEHRKGYGAAYLCGLKEAKGKYIIIADSDNTYDFYDIPRFLDALTQGYDFVMGSRFRGKMKRGAMAWSRRYIGNPILSGMFRLFFRVRLTDVLCGMRAFTSDAYRKMRLKTLGMEFATEMILSSIQRRLKIHEIPIDYYEREGYSKLRPFSDAWRYIRFMLLYCPTWLYFVPGLAGFATGMFLLLLLLRGPFLFLGHYWEIHPMVFASALCILSYQILNLGIYAHTFAIKQGLLKYDALTLFMQRNFSLEKGLMLGGLLFLIGFAINISIFLEWFIRNFGALHRIRESILAMTLLVIGLQTIFSSFFVSLLFLEQK